MTEEGESTKVVSGEVHIVGSYMRSHFLYHRSNIILTTQGPLFVPTPKLATMPLTANNPGPNQTCELMAVSADEDVNI
jgi:hypothetical protein